MASARIWKPISYYFLRPRLKKINSLFVEWRSGTFYKEIYQQLQKVSTEINYQRKRQNRRLKRNLAKRYDN